MNKNVTNSTQKGYYIVYLFSEDMERLYLTLAQGVTESTKEEMAKINEEIRQSIQMDDDIATNNNIELGGSTLAKKYEISTAAYIKYEKQLPSEQSLRNDLRRMIDYYEQYIQMKQETTGHTEVDTTNMVEETDTLTFKEIVDHIYQYIKSKGFYYEKEEVTNLFLSLKTKPFVILSGISGTGKTKIVEWFAEAIGATNDNNQFTLIPVRPDWNDSSDLLGYIDIKGDFKEGPLTKIVRNAYNNPTRPYIVLLDEMNLARVEYYLSDLLSVMESRKRENGEIITYPLLTEEIAGENLPLPSNVYIVGTVNMDETTHPFSKKVLDRANTIEFNRVELGYLDFLQELEEMDPIKLDQKSLEANYLHLKEVYDENSDLVKQVTKELVSINQVLELIHAQVGYRVRDEICMYINYNQQGNLMEYEQALDHCLLQKILPRIAGSDSRVRDVIDQLIEFCAFEIPEDTEQPIDLTYAKYPKSTAKLVEMRARLVDGFTSFWIS
ncbi:5-methylcytosine-specific restriction related enzyme [Gracilibacillus boraciitolerans JCM 21714]|uniref:5-methylcytosine-specific restriction related enzyme n=1 Tax=Gracilibacillus boraciitolerans JCM 21714 TaxID=1298598 RepID=W4VMM8_9BACI|nr:5-methylcytosine-specific restriction related enzyme [Gracilibacillus boraciitolerans JCM 21714]